MPNGGSQRECARAFRRRYLSCAVLAFSPARAQSAEADGARDRYRTVFFEHDYEPVHEHEKATENMD
jgi:hypothetical protein